jgi:hypothetical protein
MSPVTTSVEELPENKVKLHVSIPAAEFERAIDAAFRKLAGEVKIPASAPAKRPPASRGPPRLRRGARPGAP